MENLKNGDPVVSKLDSISNIITNNNNFVKGKRGRLKSPFPTKSDALAAINEHCFNNAKNSKGNIQYVEIEKSIDANGRKQVTIKARQ